MPIKLPADVDTTPADESMFQGFSRQDLKFHQALGELIDNAISGTSDPNRFKIEIHIEKNRDGVDVVVADSGVGISIADLQQKILRVGGKGSRKGKLNEHGFGLKNALCVLTQNESPFHILTRDQEAKDAGLYPKVEGPFRFSPPMQVIAGSEMEWANNMSICTTDMGTRIYARSSAAYLKSVARGGNPPFDTLMLRLLEHLGVMYRGYLENSKGEMLLRWRDVSQQTAAWSDDEVKAIPIPYQKAKEETIPVTYAGKAYSVQYKWGVLDASIAKDSTKGRPYPLKMYYQNNQSTQGIDIRVRGRVILPHQMTYLWPGLAPHPESNSFIGELIVDDPVFSTVNNKVQLDPNNPVWEAISECLQRKDYHPAETVKEAKQNEAGIRRDIQGKLKNIVAGSTVQENVPTWPAVGVSIDIVHRMVNGDEHIYEIKVGAPSPIDVYQMIMYWDARVEEGVRPKLARLVCKNESQSVANLIDYWNERKDKGGEQYKLEFKRIDSLT